MSPVPAAKAEKVEKPTKETIQAAAKKPKKPVARKVIYNDVKCEVTDLDATKAKELLGWEVEGTEESDEKFGADYFVNTDEGKVRCPNNHHNRALQMGNVLALKQEILMNRWKLNGEAIIVGKTGSILNGQHTLTAVILAEQDRANDGHWKKYWKGPISIKKLVTYGIEETDNVVNTLDTAKPRTLADVLFRSQYFADIKPAQRKAVCKIADYAIRLVWHRSGSSIDAYAPRRTHSEALDFINKHPKFLEVVKHIYDEEGGSEKRISKYISLGTAAGLCYLMAASNSDAETYLKHRSEKAVDLEHLQRAQEFWTILASAPNDYKPLRMALGNLGNPETGASGTLSEKIAVFMLAWNFMRENEFAKEPTAKNLQLEYSTIDEVTRLASKVTVAGIDMGEPKDQLDAQKDNEGEEREITPEEIEAEKARIRKEKEDAAESSFVDDEEEPEDDE